MDADMARKRREQLNAYADAMNRKRGPLRYSLHDVLGMIAQLQDVPAAPATGITPADLTIEAFGEIRGIAQRLAGVWRPATQGGTFVWRGVTEQGSLDSRLYQAASTLDTLRGMARVNAALADAVGLTRPSDATALARLLDHLSCRPPGLPENWLSASLPPAWPRLRHVNGTSARPRGFRGWRCRALLRCLPSTVWRLPRSSRPPPGLTACP
jgi:hypothetical protein